MSANLPGPKVSSHYCYQLRFDGKTLKWQKLWPHFNRLQAVACSLVCLSCKSDSRLALSGEDLHLVQHGAQVGAVFQCAKPLFVFNTNIEQDLKHSKPKSHFAHLITN